MMIIMQAKGTVTTTVKCDITAKTAVLRFELPLGSLGATYDDHLRLIEKRLVNFLLVLIELFR